MNEFEAWGPAFVNSGNSISYSEVIDFWFSDRVRRRWFASTPGLDLKIRQKFEPLWAAAAAGKLDSWRETPEGSLALVIVLDQFPLNMFRGQPECFSTESAAVDVVLQALDRGFDTQLEKERLAFLFMPLMHSEDADRQDLSVQLYEKHGLDHSLKFARHHRDIVRRFGRFPHRNAILGRDSTEAENAYLQSDRAFHG